jgi:AcrR family transcriptional regulator
MRDDRRADLQERALRYVLAQGVSGLSLRPLAAAIGTSARLLVYYFGSKEELVAALMDDVRARLQAALSAVAADPPGAGAPHPMQAFWRSLTTPATLPCVRLLFEVQVLALHDPKRYARYLDRTSASWLAAIEQALPPSPHRRAQATLGIAVIDGLLLELLATGDRRRTGAALDLFLGRRAPGKRVRS